MFTLGYRAGIVHDLALGAGQRGKAPLLPAQHCRDDLAIRGFPAEFRAVVEPALPLPQRRASPAARQARSEHALRYARAGRSGRDVCHRVRDGRARLCCQDRSARAAADQLLRHGPDGESAVQQQGPARMLPTSRGEVRVVEAQQGAAVNARGQRPCRLGHGERHLGSDAAEGERPRGAYRQRQRRDRERNRRYRPRNLYDDGADRCRVAGSAPRKRDGEARRFQPARCAGRRRLVYHLFRGLRHSWRVPRGAEGAPAAGAEGRGIAARRRQARRCAVCGRQDPARP